MRRFLAATLVLAPLSVASFMPACSKAASATSDDDAGDASVAEGSVTPIGDSDVFTADTSVIGTGFPDTGFIPVSCTTAADCVLGGLTCGYAAGGGCKAVGYCVPYQPPQDGNGLIETACGCDGQPVLYVYAGETSSPVASPTACSEAGAGDAASDATLDASVDANVDSSSAGLGCIESGGTITAIQCCASSGSFPDMCSIGACSCPPASSVATAVCECPTGMCYSASQARCLNEQ